MLQIILNLMLAIATGIIMVIKLQYRFNCPSMYVFKVLRVLQVFQEFQVLLVLQAIQVQLVLLSFDNLHSYCLHLDLMLRRSKR